MSVPEDVYTQVLEACMADRLHGARASEPARKILEEMADANMPIPAEMANYCIQNCLGYGPDGTHDGCGGIDTALAMLGAVESQDKSVISEETYGKLAVTLVNAGELDESLKVLRSMIVDMNFTPPLQVFADISEAAGKLDAEKVLTVLAFAKAAGYELDKIASTVDGRSMLASGVIAAEKLDNIALGLRLLAAASKAEGCAPDRGDDLVCSSSAVAQRACMMVHKKAVQKAVSDGEWRLSAKLLAIMMERSLEPSAFVWKNVVTCCAKAEKSKKSTALLLDWVSTTDL